MRLKNMDLVQEAFKEDGLLAKQFKGYRVRPQQVELATAIQDAITNEKNLLGEAPTGVGKSLAALIPAFETIVKYDAPVIVVTSSIILQEQYFYKDIPLLEKIFDYDTSAVLIKGRNNYVCKSKLNEFKAGNFVNSSSVNQEEMMGVFTWAQRTQTGDMSELPFVPKRSLWSQFASVTSHDCLRKECPLFNQCHYYKQRAKLKSSKLIICNYHYFFNAMGAEGMLPDNAKVVIMDEGHEVAAIARNYQEVKYNIYGLDEILNAFLKVFKRIEREQSDIDVHGITEEFNIRFLKSTLPETFKKVLEYFYANKTDFKDNVILTLEQRQSLQEIFKLHRNALNETIETINHYIEHKGLVQDQRLYWQDIHTEAEIAWQIGVETLVEGLIEIQSFLSTFLGEALPNPFGEDEESLPIKDDESVVHWIDVVGETVTIHRKPSNAAELTGPLFDLDFSIIVLSATLSVGKTFTHIKKDLGIERDDVNELIVSSPFDLQNNLLWYLPMDVPGGTERSHQGYVFEEMLKIINELHGRTLCLFTSNRNLTEAAKYFRRVLPNDIRVLAQGETPKQKLIEALRENPHTVILGTKSFFTGIDIQGQNLSAVLIDKLPFPMSGDAVNDYLMSQERGFFAFTLPEAIVSLKQGFGRLNRTADDKGIVAIYDGRVASSRSYKNIIFDSFDFDIRATRDWDAIKEYISRLDL